MVLDNGNEFIDDAIGNRSICRMDDSDNKAYGWCKFKQEFHWYTGTINFEKWSEAPRKILGDM